MLDDPEPEIQPPQTSSQCMKGPSIQLFLTHWKEKIRKTFTSNFIPIGHVSNQVLRPPPPLSSLSFPSPKSLSELKAQKRLALNTSQNKYHQPKLLYQSAHRRLDPTHTSKTQLSDPHGM